MMTMLHPQTQNNKMQDIKDNVANLTSVAGTGGFIMGWNEILTLILILTGIILNLVRIYEIKRRKSNDEGKD